jgi:4-amino-4-deoxy-L-arabinose transferase-like glycosyltransferase
VKASAGKKGDSARLLTDATRRVGSSVHHAALLDAALVTAQPEKSRAFLATARLKSPGTELLLLALNPETCTQATAILETPPADPSATTITIPCLNVSGPAGLADLDSRLAGLQWSRVLYLSSDSADAKGGSQSIQAAAPLDHWLAGLCYRLFGFSETSSRLPSLLLGLALLPLLFCFLRRLTDLRTAGLATVITLLFPIFLGQARNMAGEISNTLFLSLGVLSFANMALLGGTLLPALGLLTAALLLLLSKGLFAVAVLLLTILAYVLMEGRPRKATLLPLLGLSALFLALVALVLLPSGWTFFSHLKFMYHPFNGGPDVYRTAFDYFLRQLGFGLFPWVILLPLALSLAARRLSDPKPGLFIIALVWFLVPFLVHSAGIYWFRHTVFPAAPAAALLIALLLRDDEAAQPDNSNRDWLTAFLVAGLAAVIAQGIFKSSETLVTWLTTDPHIKTSMKGLSNDTGELPTIAKALAALFVLVVLQYQARVSSFLDATGRALARRQVSVLVLWLAALLFLANAATFFIGRFQGLRPPKTMAPLDPQLTQFHLEQMFLRPDLQAILLLLVLVGLVAVVVGTPLGALLLRARPLARAAAFLQRLSARFHLVPLGAAALAVAVALAALVDLLVTFPFQSDRPLALLFARPDPVVALLLGAALGALALLLRRRLPPAPLLATALVLPLLTLASMLFRHTDGAALDIRILVSTAAVLLALSWLPLLHRFSLARHLTAALLYCWLLAFLVAPLALTWRAIETTTLGSSTALSYVLTGSLLTRIALALLLIPLAANALPALSALLERRHLPRLATALRPVALARHLEAPRAFIPAVLVLGLLFGGWYSLKFLPDFSIKVSQKHILDKYLKIEGLQAPTEGLFKFRGEGGGGDDRNFYTAPIPELTSLDNVMDVLLAPDALQVSVTRASSHPGPDKVSLPSRAQRRRFVVMDQDSFTQADHKYRKAIIERDGDKAPRPIPHIPVVDGTNKAFLLAADSLPPEVPNDNRFAAVTMSHAQFDAEKGITKAYVNLEDRLHLLGYRLDARSINRGSTLRLELFFETVADISASYKIFMHLDAASSGNRINGDHWPLSLENDPEKKECVGCWKTSQWLPGDIVVDRYDLEIPLGTPSGTQNIFMGLYLPGSGKRMKVQEVGKNVMHEGNDRFLIGTFEVN